MLNEKMTNIAEAIRERSGITEKLSLDDMAVGVESVYFAGYTKGDDEGFLRGHADGYESGYQKGHEDGLEDAGSGDSGDMDYAAGYETGYDEGRQAEHDRFWDAFFTQKYTLAYMFAGCGWTDETFRPPNGTVISSANCVSKSASQMFQGAYITDLKGICEERNITLDFSATTGFSQTFCDCYITAVPTIDTRSASNVGNMFWTANRLVTVEKLILKNDGSQSCTNTFNGVPALQNIVIEGKFGKSVDVKTATKLSKASIESIVNALSDTAEGQTLTLSKTAVDTAFGDSGGEYIGSESIEWEDLVNTRPNWEIKLV